MPDSPSTGLSLTDLDAPDPQLLGAGTGSPVPPAQRIYFYSPEEWELFILEWAFSLHPKYEQVKRIGGSGDQGIDIAAFASERHFEGPWDLFQAKHYAHALTPAVAHAEIFKMLSHVVQGDYVLPRRYFFVAPRGSSATLNRLLSHATEMKEKFLVAVADGSTLARDVDPAMLDSVRALAANLDFSMFVSTQLIELLDDHSKTQYHAFRFGTALPARGPIAPPPSEIAAHEARYVEQLLDVYSETNGTNRLSTADVETKPEHSTHFHRQRRAFYSAEALRIYARDSVPEGTFSSLVDHVFEGVIEVAESPHESGRSRLTAVLTQSVNLQLDGHRLVTMTGPEDRRGICHHLANEDRLKWVV